MNNQFFNTNDNVTNEKKKGKGRTVLLVLLLSIIISGGIFAILYYTNVITLTSQIQKCDNTKYNVSENNNSNKLDNNDAKYYYFKNGNVSDQSEYNYSLTQGVDGVYIKDFYGYQSTVKLDASRSTKKDEPLDPSIDVNSIKSEYTLSFSKNVVDILADHASNSIGESGVFLFLMEDGTVEYLPITKALRAKDVKSYGKINGLENIVRFYSSGKDPKNDQFGGNYALLAQDKDGKLYDISKLIDNVIQS